MSRARPLGRRHVVAVALGLPLGAGVFALPRGVENLGGPATPIAYLVGTLALSAVATAYAVYLSSPLATRDGLLYLAVSRTWGSRRLGFLVAWPAVGAYAAILAALVAALGRSFAGVSPLSPTVAALTVLVAVVVVHALGPAVAARCQLLVTGPLLLALLVMAAVGLTAVAPDNFAPLFPTPTLRTNPLGAIRTTTVATLFGFVGFEAGAALSPAVRDPRRTTPRALLVGAVVAGLVAAVAATVALGVIPWTRLVFATAPFADAAASGLGVQTATLLGPGTLVATFGAALATAWLPTRTLRGLAETVPGLDRETPPGVPDPALAVTGALAGAVVALDAVGPALYLALPGVFIGYAALSLSVAVLPSLRPALSSRCRLSLPPAALAGVGLLGALVAGSVLAATLTRDPATSLGYTRFAPALAVVDGAVLVRDPLSSVVPALLLWELAGVVVLAVAADYRADRGVERPPLDTAYEDE
ncbi:APC family permease [Haloplanus vescus]|uniref:APC family permease n=1 Tax=Haloplanus vescus TaxID=555874 RepID=UPI0015A18051|nr:amino acid permease [Haloplanus vescus]